MKTNAARFLESLGISFELRDYDVDPDDLSALTVAKKVGMPPEQVFKTLVTTDGRGDYAFAVVPGDAELDLKKLARAADWRKADMTPLKDVQPLTGYIRGGVTIFGAKKPYPVFVDETVILFDQVSVSAGTRGTQIILSPSDYLRAAEALGQPVATVDLAKQQKVGAPGPSLSGTGDWAGLNTGAPGPSPLGTGDWTELNTGAPGPSPLGTGDWAGLNTGAPGPSQLGTGDDKESQSR